MHRLFNAQITPFYTWVTPVVPSVYQEMLSYYEVVCALADKINDIIRYVDELAREVLEKSMQYTDIKIDELKMDVEAIRQKLQAQIDEIVAKHEEDIKRLDAELAELHAELLEKEEKLYQHIKAENIKLKAFVVEEDTEIRNQHAQDMADQTIALNNAIQNLKDYSDAEDTLLRNQADRNKQELQNNMDDMRIMITARIMDLQNKYNELSMEQIKLSDRIEDYRTMVDDALAGQMIQLKNYIDSVVSTIDNVYAINPKTFERQPLNKVLQSMWDDLRFGRIRAKEYQVAQIPAKDYQIANVTAQQYDIEGKFAIGLFPWFYLRMLNPFTGIMDTYANIINQLAAFHKHPITASEYDALGLTAGVYDAKMLTGYQYDVQGKELLIGGN